NLKLDFPRIEFLQSSNRIQQRRFAAARWPEQARDAVVARLEGDAVEDAHLGAVLADERFERALDADRRHYLLHASARGRQRVTLRSSQPIRPNSMKTITIRNAIVHASTAFIEKVLNPRTTR